MNLLEPSPEEKTVYGENTTSRDVKNVQEAVDKYELVKLIGTFSFAGGEAGTPKAVIRISRSVQILGAGATRPIINGGERPFYIVNSDASVAFQGLHFKDSRGIPIQAVAADRLTVVDCKFETVVSVPNVTTMALAIAGARGMVSIQGNDISIGGTAADTTNGILGITPQSTNIDISGNVIKNVTAHGIDVRSATGDVKITGNTITPGEFGRSGISGQFVDAIRCLGTGTYVVLDNTITINFENAAGIRLGGTSGAIVSGNTLHMSLNNTAGLQSAGIQIQGTCVSSRVDHNKIRGGARVALAAIHSDAGLDKPAGTSGDPANTSFEGNEHLGFSETFADIEVGTGATDTRIVAPIRTEFPPSPGVGEARATARAGSETRKGLAAKTAPADEIEGTVSDSGTGTVIVGKYTILQ